MLRRLCKSPDWVREGLEKTHAKVLRRTTWPAPWGPAQIVSEIAAGKVALYAWEETGFFVMELLAENGHRFLHVWVMWFKPGTAKAARAELMPEVDRVKREMNCEWIQFGSPFRGWTALEHEGFKPHTTIWRR